MLKLAYHQVIGLFVNLDIFFFWELGYTYREVSCGHRGQLTPYRKFDIVAYTIIIQDKTINIKWKLFL